MEDIKLAIKKYYETRLILFWLIILSFIGALVFLNFNFILGSLFIIIFIGCFVRIISIQKKLGVILNEYKIITLSPLAYGLLFLLWALSLNLIGIVIYFIFVKSDIERLEKSVKEASEMKNRTNYDTRDGSEFKGISKDEALRRWRYNPNDKRSWGEIVGIWKKVNKKDE